MLIVSAFTNSGVPVTGLTPTIDIWRLTDDVQVVTGDSMAEVGGGFYKYDFTTYVDTIDYAVRANGGATLSAPDRYQFSTDEVKSDTILGIDRFNRATAKIENQQLTFSDANGTIQVWDLFDSVGAPTDINVFDRRKI